MSSFSWLEDEPLETDIQLESSLIHKRRPGHRRSFSELRKEKLEEFLKDYPKDGETWHIVSNGSFDYWQFVPVLIGIIGEPVTEFYGSTWTISRPNALELFDLIDRGKIQKAAMFSGLYFKRRETAVYATLVEGMMERGHRFLCFENHSKIILMRFQGGANIVIEGSANFTANPRLEQNTITNDADLFDFHAGWMESVWTRCRK